MNYVEVVYAAAGGTLSDSVFTALLYGSAWGVGYSLRQRAQRISELSQAC